MSLCEPRPRLFALCCVAFFTLLAVSALAQETQNPTSLQVSALTSPTSATTIESAAGPVEVPSVLRSVAGAEDLRNPDGTLIYRVRLRVPPNPNGITPELSLVYD